MKKDGGTIKNWQLHHITLTEDETKLFVKHFPDAIIHPIVFTGTVVDDPTGRWQPGYHMRSTYIVSFDRDTGIVESLNTMYKLDMETEGTDIIPDLGRDVLKIFY